MSYDGDLLCRWGLGEEGRLAPCRPLCRGPQWGGKLGVRLQCFKTSGMYSASAGFFVADLFCLGRLLLEKAIDVLLPAAEAVEYEETGWDDGTRVCNASNPVGGANAKESQMRSSVMISVVDLFVFDPGGGRGTEGFFSVSTPLSGLLPPLRV